jgi:hypothetical protein
VFGNEMAYTNTPVFLHRQTSGVVTDAYQSEGFIKVSEVKLSLKLKLTGRGGIGGREMLRITLCLDNRLAGCQP